MGNKFTQNIFSSFALFSILLISVPAHAQDKNKDSEIAELKEKIEMMEKKLQTQENQINKLKNEIEELKKKRPILAVPDLKDQNGFRKWKPFKYNGQLYYMVPLNTETSKKENNK